MLLNGSAVNVVAVNAIDRIVIALQGLSQFSTASVSDLRLVANMIAASSINYSGSGSVNPAVVVQGSASYSVGTDAINTLVAKLAGLSGTNISSAAANRLSSRFASSSSHTFNTLGIITAAMVMAAESSGYNISSGSNTPKLISSLQALSQVLINSEASNRLTVGTGTGVASFSVVADSTAPISGVFYSGLASYTLGSNADNLLVSGLSGVSNIAVSTDASVYTFMSMDGSSGFDLNSESMVYLITTLSSSGVEFTVSSSGDNYLSTYVEGVSNTAAESQGKAHVVKFSLTVDDESAYVVDGLELVYNVA